MQVRGESKGWDNEEWQAVVEAYYHPIFRFIVQYTGDRYESADLTQEVFLKAYQKRTTLHERSAIKGWLYQIARNTCIDRARWWKRFATFRQGLKDTTERYEPPVLSPIGDRLLQYIRELPQRQREAFLLRHWHDCSTEETASIMNLSQGAVKSHLKRAVDRLRGLVEQDPMLRAEQAPPQQTDTASGTSSEADRGDKRRVEGELRAARKSSSGV